MWHIQWSPSERLPTTTPTPHTLMFSLLFCFCVFFLHQIAQKKKRNDTERNEERWEGERERERRKNSRSSRRAQFVYLLPLSQNIYLWKSPLNLLEWYCKSSVLGSWFCAFRFLIFHFHFTLFTFHIPIYLVLCFVLFCFLAVAAFSRRFSRW